LEHKLATTPEVMKQVFGSMPRCRMAMETGTHSPWVSRLLTALGHEVIVAHAQKLAILLHRLWVSGEVYEPLRNSQKAMTAAA
jgi:hypothetical protein